MVGVVPHRTTYCFVHDRRLVVFLFIRLFSIISWGGVSMRAMLRLFALVRGGGGGIFCECAGYLFGCLA